jgi:DNA-binding CsgD family transcriptional regulator
MARVRAIADPAAAADPGYVEGLRIALGAAVDYGLASIESTAAPPIPVTLLAQARTAARNAVSLDTVLRRYFAGYSLLGYLIVEEATGLMDGPELQRLLGAQAVVFDRLLAAIGEEHAREAGSLHLNSEQKRSEQIERLLAGQLIDTTAIAYDFDGWHLGVVVAGRAAVEGIRAVAREHGLRLLLVDRGEERDVWCWLGAHRPLGSDLADGICGASRPDDVLIAIGEPARGIPGWRLTHRQAAAALPVAQRGEANVVRYRDVALLAAALRDDLLTASLRQAYLRPLEEERDGGLTLRETLHAYVLGHRSLSAAAATLGVSRRTVGNRLLRVEERLGCALHTVMGDLETAIKLDLLDASRVTFQNGPSRLT